MRERRDGLHRDQPAFPRARRAPGVSSGRGPEDLNPGRRVFRVPLSHPPEPAGGSLLVSPTHSRVQHESGHGRSLGRTGGGGPGARHTGGGWSAGAGARGAGSEPHQPRRAAIAGRARDPADPAGSRWRFDQYAHRLRQAGERPVDQLRAGAVPGLPAGPDCHEAGGTSAMAPAQRLCNHLSAPRGAVRRDGAAPRDRRHRRRAH